MNFAGWNAEIDAMRYSATGHKRPSSNLPGSTAMCMGRVNRHGPPSDGSITQRGDASFETFYPAGVYQIGEV